MKTSKKLGGVGGGAHEVNRRSVLASQKLGQAGLTDFCARMNLPPPVTKKSFNELLIQIEKAAVEHAKVQMQDAARSLKQQLSKERKLSPGKTLRLYHPQAERNMWRSQLQNPQAERNMWKSHSQNLFLNLWPLQKSSIFM